MYQKLIFFIFLGYQSSSRPSSCSLLLVFFRLVPTCLASGESLFINIENNNPQLTSVLTNRELFSEIDTEHCSLIEFLHTYTENKFRTSLEFGYISRHHFYCCPKREMIFSCLSALFSRYRFRGRWKTQRENERGEIDRWSRRQMMRSNNTTRFLSLIGILFCATCFLFFLRYREDGLSPPECREDICRLPDCSCGGEHIPGNLLREDVPQMVLLTFDDEVPTASAELYAELFERSRVNPNGCPIAATFYVQHRGTDYSLVQNLYAAGHEIASHSISHGDFSNCSQSEWEREIVGQREMLAAYGRVRPDDVRGMRAPYLAIGGDEMLKMLYHANFTYDASMLVRENGLLSWPYTFDYKLFHRCNIEPCPTKSYPGVWEIPMANWVDLEGEECCMADSCNNPKNATGVYTLLMNNFRRYFTKNRAPFGLFYHLPWFRQPHHKEGLIRFLDTILKLREVWLVTTWQAVQWIKNPTPLSRLHQFAPFNCDYSERPERCENPNVCRVRGPDRDPGFELFVTCQPCPRVFPWVGNIAGTES